MRKTGLTPSQNLIIVDLNYTCLLFRMMEVTARVFLGFKSCRKYEFHNIFIVDFVR